MDNNKKEIVLPGIITGTGSNIKIAEQDKVEELQEYIDELLEIIGHPEALVTNRSTLWDFHLTSAEDEVEELSSRLGFKVYKNTYLVDIAEEMKKIR